MPTEPPQLPEYASPFVVDKAFVSSNSSPPTDLGRLEPPTPSAAPSWLTAFAPRRGLFNGHLQTIFGNYLPRPPFRVPFTTEAVEVDPADGSRVLCHGHWQPGADRNRRLTVVMVHGLEGSSESRYIQGLTMRAWAAGCNIVRMNMRNCGDSDALTPTLYHSGLSADVGAVVEHFTRQFEPRTRGSGRLLHGRKPGDQTCRGVGRPTAALRRCRGLPGHRPRGRV